MTDLDLLAINASRCLMKFGSETPDWQEWVDLKNSLLRIQGSLGREAREVVGRRCSEFNQRKP